MDGVGGSGHQAAQELGRHHLARLLVQLRVGELGGAVDGHEEIELALGGLHLGDIDVEVPDRIGSELLANRLVAFDLRQVADPMALQAAM